MGKTINDKSLIEAYKSGELITWLFDSSNSFETDESTSLLTQCIELHNSGQIDLLSLIRNPEFERIDGHRFFIGQHFFCKTVPKLNSTTEEMMRCIHLLVEKGGADLFANQPNIAFQEWCKMDLTRAREVIDAAKNNDSLANEFLTFALTAGNMIEEARDFVEKYTDGRRISGISALARMNFDTPAQTHETLSTLLSALDNEPDDQLCANVLMSALEVAEKTDRSGLNDALLIVKRACTETGSFTLHACARALCLHGKSLSEDAVVLLLQSLRSVDPSNKGTIQEIDNGLCVLLGTPHWAHAITYVEDLLTASDVISLSELQRFSRKILEGPGHRFHDVFVSWMLSGKKALCEGLNEALRNSRSSEKPIDLPMQHFKLPPIQQVFLCRKAIGYLFFQPVIAGSILVSVLRECDDDVADVVCSLLVDPLLLNYGGNLRNYLSTIEANDPAYTHIQAAINENDRYLEGLGSVSGIKELRPSEHERQIERLRSHEKMLRSWKMAQKESAILTAVKRSVVLYGKKSITYVEASETGERRPVEMELQPHSVAIEVPRVEIVDPVGLDYMLRIFRVERLKS
jgi:hypothetical protein